MLVFKATQVIACHLEEPKPWEFSGKSGVSHSAKLALLGGDGNVATVTLKAKSADELKAKVVKYTPGKSAEVPIVSVTPVFRSGERKASAYEYQG